MRLLTLFGILIVALMACKQKSEVTAALPDTTEVQTKTVQSDTIPNIILDPKMGQIESDPISIELAYVEGDILHLQVQHSGGCEDHSYVLRGTGMYMKSLPPQTVIILDHNAHGDNCRALISKTLKFNIKALQYTGSNKLIIHLTGYPEQIEYTY